MKKYIIVSLFFIMIMATGCTSRKISKNRKINFEIKDNKFLIIKYNSNNYYVGNKTTTSNDNEIIKNAYIVKDNNDKKLMIKYDMPEGKKDMAIIYNIDFKNETICINDINYKINTEKKGWNENGLDLNVLFKNRYENIELNPNNLNEFIDKSGNILKIGGQVNNSRISYMLSPIKLNGKIIETVSYNVDSGKIYGKKELALILTDQKEASKIKTITYEGIYKIDNGKLAVFMNGKYFELIE